MQDSLLGLSLMLGISDSQKLQLHTSKGCLQNTSLGGMGDAGRVEPPPPSSEQGQLCHKKDLQACTYLTVQRNGLHITDRTFCICAAAKCKWLSLNQGRCCRERLRGLGPSRASGQTALSATSQSSDAGQASSAGSTNGPSPGSVSSPQAKCGSKL